MDLMTYALAMTVILSAFTVGTWGKLNNTMPSHEHRLVKDLFKYYDPMVRPRYNSSHTVNVRVRFSLQQINDLDEKRQILKISGWITAEWFDDFLTWDPDEYGGLTSVVVPPKQLWVPKLAIGNSATKLFDGEHYRRFWITVRHTGEARWQPGGVFSIACALDMNFYPFDDQRCTIEIETWVYTADKVNLTNSMDTVGIDTYVPHGEWTIIKTHVRSVNVVYRYYLSESFPEVYFTIFIRRKYTFYFLYILLPCLMLSGVLLMVFLLPADSGEKVSLGVSILVAISVFLLLVAGKVPDTSDAIPIIAIYLTYFMMITTIAVALSVVVIKIHFKTTDIKPPQWLRTLAFQYLARFTCLDLHQKYYKSWLNKRRQKRDMTWSETLTEEIKSHNSRGTLSSTPDGQENYELLHQRRKDQSDAEPNDVRDPSTARAQPSAAPAHYASLLHGGVDSHYDILEKTESEPNEWRKIAEIFDRFFFWVFLVSIVVPTVFILGFLRLFKDEL